MSEVQEKLQIEIEIIKAITEAELILDGSIPTVESNCQHQEARTGTNIGRKRVVPRS